MTLILPIMIVSLIIGVSAKRMTTPLWMLVFAVIVLSVGYFYLRH